MEQIMKAKKNIVCIQGAHTSHGNTHNAYARQTKRERVKHSDKRNHKINLRANAKKKFEQTKNSKQTLPPPATTTTPTTPTAAAMATLTR